MFLRSCIAVLILTNYLWLAGIGCISRPEENPYMVRVRTTGSVENIHYEECRYLRMDGLESFMEEALATRYQDAPDSGKHHTISVISGIDAHFAPQSIDILLTRIFRETAAAARYLTPGLRDVTLAIYSPPE